MSNLIENIKDFFFPKICIISDKKLSKDNSNDFIDDKILEKLERLKADDLIEMRGKIKSDFFNSFLSFKIDNPVQTIIHYLKYNGFSKIGYFLGRFYGEEYIKINKRILDYDLICPVPLFATKIRERGYNQSDFICDGINSLMQKEQVNNLIIRTRHTKSQTHLKYFERLANVKDAFKINEKYEGKIQGKSILLIDDVATTGATINEVIKVIRNQNAKEISAFTIASAR